MKNIKAITGIMLIFLLGAASGSLVTHTIDRARHESFVKGGPQARDEEIVKRLTRKLDLDRSQQEQVRVIVRESHDAIRRIHGFCRPQVHAQLEQGQARINALLRPEQQEKFRRIIAERKAHLPPGMN